jgi:hypothetical protein
VADEASETTGNAEGAQGGDYENSDDETAQRSGPEESAPRAKTAGGATHETGTGDTKTDVPD